MNIRRARTQVVSAFDVNKDGSISFDEFLRGIRGGLSKRRRGMVRLAFDVLDKDRSGEVTQAEMGAAYDTSRHPEVVAGKKTREAVLREFMEQWHEHDGVVSLRSAQLFLYHTHTHTTHTQTHTHTNTHTHTHTHSFTHSLTYSIAPLPTSLLCA